MNRYTIALSVVALIAVAWVKCTTAAVSFYREQAEAVNGQRPRTTIETLTSSAVEGRALGTVGMQVAVEWIAHQFEELGLQAAGEEFTYFQTLIRDYERLDSIPTLAVEGVPSAYQDEFSEFPGYTRIMGEAKAPVRFVAIGEQTR